VLASQKDVISKSALFFWNQQDLSAITYIQEQRPGGRRGGKLTFRTFLMELMVEVSRDSTFWSSLT